MSRIENYELFYALQYSDLNVLMYDVRVLLVGMNESMVNGQDGLMMKFFVIDSRCRIASQLVRACVRSFVRELLSMIHSFTSLNSRAGLEHQ